MIKKVKSIVPWTYVIGDLKSVEIFGTICKKEFQKNKKNQKKFIVEKVINRKGDILHVQGKATILLLTIGLIKKVYYK